MPSPDTILLISLAVMALAAVTALFMLVESFRMAEYAAKKGRFSKEEAKAYLDHPILGNRLREISQALLECGSRSVEDIFGFPDDLKVRSCMTLFDLVSPNDIFNDVLFHFYESQRCDKTIWRLGFHENKLKNQVKLSGLAIFLLFLNHPEGIAFKCLPDYRKELTAIYNKLKPWGLTDRALQSIEDVTNPLLNSINEKCSRIRAAFINEVDSSLLDNYIVTGKSGDVKKISIPRNLITWE